MNSILFAPHNDDEALFAAFTIMREKPLVVIVTDSYIQPNRGEKGCDADTRWNETKKAMEILGAPVMRLGIPDLELDYHKLGQFFQKCFHNFETVYAPALQEGNLHHDIVHRACKVVFGDKVKEYTTYAPGQLYTTGKTEIVPTPEELELKSKALECYQSQLNLAATRPHFEAVKGKSEWLM